MSFISTEFFAIVIFTIVAYFVFPRKYRWYILLATSCTFYILSAGIWSFAITLVTIAITYLASIWLENSTEKQKKKRMILSTAIILLAGLWALLKAKSYFDWNIGWLVIPFGVSYYLLSLIGYLVDVYAKKEKAERNPLKLALYTLFFPKIMQGPISKFRDIAPKLIEGHSFSYVHLSYGVQRILWGYFKKLVITERAILLTRNVFDGNISDYTGGGFILLIITFIAVISHYCDFSGYMDIVIGISEIMGIELDENFRQPFFSKTAAEFWRRWHITLGTWFKDYVYMALVISPKINRIGKWVRNHIGKRAGKAVLTIIPLSIVWLLTGIWHGTGMDYLLWGCYWGFIIIVSNIFAPEIKKVTKTLRIKTDSWDWKVFQMLRTFSLFTGGLLLSTLVGYKQINQYIHFVIKDFSFSSGIMETLGRFGLDRQNTSALLIAIAVLWAVEVLQSKGSVREKMSRMNGPIKWIIYATLFLSIILLGIYGPGYSISGFAYARF